MAHLPPLSQRANKEKEVSEAQVKGTMGEVARTSAGLRDAIFDEIDAIRNGSSNPTRANAVAKLASGVVETVRMELEVQRHWRNATKDERDQINQPKIGADLALGRG